MLIDSIHTYTAGIYVNTWATQNGGSGTVISNNVIHDIGYAGENSNAGTCLWTDTTVDISVTSNTIYNCSATGLRSEKTLNQLYAYNTIANAGNSLYTAGLEVETGGGFASRNNAFYNNTVYNSGWWGLGIHWEDTDSGTLMSGNVVANNIIAQYTSGGLFYADRNTANAASAVLSHNNFGGASSCWIVYPSCISSYASLDTAYGNSTYSVQGNPVFVGPPTSFALQASSPDIGAGIYVSGISSTNPPNIGAQ